MNDWCFKAAGPAYIQTVRLESMINGNDNDNINTNTNNNNKLQLSRS